MCSVMAGGKEGKPSKLLIPVAGSRWPMIVHLSGHHFMSERSIFSAGVFRQRLTGGRVRQTPASCQGSCSQVSLDERRETGPSIKLLSG